MENLPKENWATKQLTQEKYDARGEKGDVVEVRPDDLKWGRLECPPDYVKIKVPTLDHTKTKPILEGGVYDLVLEDNVKSIIPVDIWETTYALNIIPPKAENIYASVPVILNTVHKIGGIAGYEVRGQAWKNKLFKKRKFRVPASLVDQALLNHGELTLTDLEFISYLRKRELDTNKVIVENTIAIKDLNG